MDLLALFYIWSSIRLKAQMTDSQFIRKFGSLYSIQPFDFQLNDIFRLFEKSVTFFQSFFTANRLDSVFQCLYNNVPYYYYIILLKIIKLFFCLTIKRAQRYGGH
jgi:hypothetical protein